MGSAFQEQQEGLTMKLLRLLPFCSEALKERHSASFSSSCLRWGFYREQLQSLGLYRASSLMAWRLIDWWLCLWRCCKSCSGVTLADIITHHVILWLFCHVHRLAKYTFTHARCHVHEKRGKRCWCIHSSHCACAPESCVYFSRCCTCNLWFVHQS